VRIVCISDTHRLHKKLSIPECDVLVHAGDIGVEDNIKHLIDFNTWLESLDYIPHKVVIPGNHDLEVESSPLTAKAMMQGKGIHFLIDEEVIIDGVKFYGSPWQPWFHDWAWNEQRGEPLRRIWAKIPTDTDVLITHGPPYGILDEVIYGGKSVGCEELRKRVLEVQPKLHIFGHIHEGYGYFSEGKTQYVNASILSHDGPLNPPQVIELDV
jgi:Icc-related predicted phosphoesterase